MLFQRSKNAVSGMAIWCFLFLTLYCKRCHVYWLLGRGRRKPKAVACSVLFCFVLFCNEKLSDATQSSPTPSNTTNATQCDAKQSKASLSFRSGNWNLNWHRLCGGSAEDLPNAVPNQTKARNGFGKTAGRVCTQEAVASPSKVAQSRTIKRGSARLQPT